MKMTITELRAKHWAGKETLYPKTTSQNLLQTRYDHDAKADEGEVAYAQEMFRLAIDYRNNGQEEEAVKACNMANYYLAGAYQRDDINGEFWEQFL